MSFLTYLIFAKIINYELDMGAIPNNPLLDITINNTNIMNNIVKNISAGDIFFIPNNTYYLMGGVLFNHLQSVIIKIDGTLIFSDNLHAWPKDDDNNPVGCIYFGSTNNVIITSSGTGTINGNGKKWWRLIETLILVENRPKLFHMKDASNIIIENILFINSPYWTVHIQDVKGLVIRYSTIINRLTEFDRHTLWDYTAFNTDGFDIEGEDVHIHDCYIWTQDDCIAVKGNSKNMLFERINASGLGLTIGSIGSETVDNITFRNCYMHNTAKGIYVKFNGAADDFSGGLITNILYENITIESPSQYAIWIGPAQQSDSRFLCHPNPCSLCWPWLKPYAKCNIPSYGNFSNIILKNIAIHNPKKHIGVLMAPIANPMKNLIFDNVVSDNKEINYICQGVNGITLGNTTPIPLCF